MSTLEKRTRFGTWLPVAGKLGLGAISLISANSAVLIVFLVYDATLLQLVLVYWCECVWIGIFSAIKLITASIIGDPFENRFADVSRGAAVLMSLFVVVFSSSAFFSLLGMMLISILFANEWIALSNPNDEIFSHIGLVLGASGLLLGGHAVSLASNFLLLGEYKTASVGMLVTLPFRRSIALFVAIAASIAFAALVPAFASTTAFVLAVIVLKVLWDIRLHFKERHAFAVALVPGVAQ